VKDHGAKGDGSADDTEAVQSALWAATAANLIYFPAGSYIITSTLFVPPHARMTGEVWSQLVAAGTFFADMKNPKPMVRVGNPGDSGTVEISDMLFTSIGALPGLVLMEWNVRAQQQGSVSIWDAHFRVGGAYGSGSSFKLTPLSLFSNSLFFFFLLFAGTMSTVEANNKHRTSGSSVPQDNVDFIWLYCGRHDASHHAAVQWLL